jgi:hypothetical protein
MLARSVATRMARALHAQKEFVPETARSAP